MKEIYDCDCTRIPSYIHCLSLFPFNSHPNLPFIFFILFTCLPIPSLFLLSSSGWLWLSAAKSSYMLSCKNVSDGEQEGVWEFLKGKIILPGSPLRYWRDCNTMKYDRRFLSARPAQFSPFVSPYSSRFTIPSLILPSPSLPCCTRTAPYLHICCNWHFPFGRFYISCLSSPWKRSQGFRLAS